MKTDNNGTVLYNRSELQAVFSAAAAQRNILFCILMLRNFDIFLADMTMKQGRSCFNRF